MKNVAEIKARYLQDNVPIRLGGLAADLARIASIAQRPANARAVATLLEESKHFIEWTAPQVTPEVGSELAEMQIALTIWQSIWPEVQSNRSLRALLAVQARSWSNSTLRHPGLLG